jgi:hypothetical protein
MLRQHVDMNSRSSLTEVGTAAPIERELTIRGMECGVPVRSAVPASRSHWALYCSALRQSTAVGVVAALLISAYLGQRYDVAGTAVLAGAVIWLALRRAWVVWIAAGALLIQQFMR